MLVSISISDIIIIIWINLIDYRIIKNLSYHRNMTCFNYWSKNRCLNRTTANVCNKISSIKFNFQIIKQSSKTLRNYVFVNIKRSFSILQIEFFSLLSLWFSILRKSLRKFQENKLLHHINHDFIFVVFNAITFFLNIAINSSFNHLKINNVANFLIQQTIQILQIRFLYDRFHFARFRWYYWF